MFYPNYNDRIPESRLNFWAYEPEIVGWHIYGIGRVNSDGSQVIPDPGVEIYEFTGAMVGGGFVPADTWCQAGSTAYDGDPVDCGSGLFIESKIDIWSSTLFLL